MLKIKVCGMVSKNNVKEVAALSPDFMGFIFYQSSPRYVGEHLELPDWNPAIRKVAVFVNETTENILKTCDRYQIKMAQLHGDESPLFCQQLQSGGLEIIKAFALDEQFDFQVLQPYQNAVDYFLLDAKGKYKGGNGLTFNWQLLDKYKLQIPFFLSGGINADNVAAVKNLRHERLFAIDVNSGVEDQPGLKSPSKLNELVQNFKR